MNNYNLSMLSSNPTHVDTNVCPANTLNVCPQVNINDINISKPTSASHPIINHSSSSRVAVIDSQPTNTITLTKSTSKCPSSKPYSLQANHRQHPVKIGLWNARSLCNKLDFFQSLVYSKCFDVICVTETWLTTSILDKEILPYNYTIYRHDRGSRGGGILVDVSVNIPSKCVFNSSSSEVIGIQLSLLPCLHLYCVYIPPSSSCSSSYHSVTLNTLNSVPLDSSCVVVGDFNAPDITWSTQSASISTSIQLCNFCHSKNLIQKVHNPTHRQGNILDIILTNSPDRFFDVYVDSSSCTEHSDHFLISFKCSNHRSNLHSNSNTHSQFYNFSRANLPEIDSFLIDYNFLTHSSDIQSVWSCLKQGIHLAYDQFIPTVRLPSNPSLPWFNSEIRHLLKKIHTLRRSIRKSPTINRNNKLCLLEERVSRLIQSSKHSYEANLVSSFSSNPKKLYSHLKRLANNKFIQKFLVQPSAQSLTAEPKEKSEIFNDFFHSTFTNSNYRLPPLESLSSPLHHLSNISITPSDVYEHLSQLDPTKVAGCDNIHPKILKFCATSLTEPVTHLFNLCLSQSNIPFE